jgi:hypothetical protein
MRYSGPGRPTGRTVPCPRPEDLGREARYVYLCGECGVVLLRVDRSDAIGARLLFCLNCGATNGLVEGVGVVGA